MLAVVFTVCWELSAMSVAAGIAISFGGIVQDGLSRVSRVSKFSVLWFVRPKCFLLFICMAFQKNEMCPKTKLGLVHRICLVSLYPLEKPRLLRATPANARFFFAEKQKTEQVGCYEIFEMDRLGLGKA